jgi:NADH:ubiquinone oxidoreductase subunit 6 (subunit J)
MHTDAAQELVINWHTFFFLFFALVACVFAIAVVVSSNIVRMAFYLVMSLGATAGIFFVAGADFVGSMQLLIYVGGTLVLLVFGVMLTAQGPFVSMKTRGGDWIMALLLSGCLFALLVPAAFSVKDWQAGKTKGHIVQEDTAARLGMGLLGARVDKLEDRPAELKPGMSGFLLPFEIVSVHLLVVLVGAAYLARTKKRAAS